MSSPPVMTYFDPTRNTKLLVDGSKYGLASMLVQIDLDTGRHKVVRYDSQPTTDPESRYAQIEIESTAIAFAIKRNHIYLYGLPEFTVITDHKPLLPLYNTYRADLPPRILKHKINLQGYSFKLEHDPGKDNPSDYMSRHPTKISSIVQKTELLEANTINGHVNAIIRDDLPAAITLDQMKMAMTQDILMQQLMTSIRQGYIDSNSKQQLSRYHNIFDELSIVEGMVLRGSKLVIPEKLKKNR